MPFASPRVSLRDIPTPSLIVDIEKMEANIERMRSRLAGFNVLLRPHLKTVKSADIARRMMPTSTGPATVSTLAEAEFFADAGIKDILYAVPLTPSKLERVTALRSRGIDLSVITDCVEAAHAIASASRIARNAIPVLIEIDCDGCRTGVPVNSGHELIAIAKTLEGGGSELRGVMTHSGSSYDSGCIADIEAAAEQERRAAVDGAAVLRSAGMGCPIVSVGSTPTALFGQNFSGVTEVRAGVFVFFDLVMAGIDVCRIEEIAISVLATVISRQEHAGRIIVDAGWTALSRDRGTAKQRIDQSYGIVCNIDGQPFPDLIVEATNQEHGVLVMRAGSTRSLPDLRLGDRVRILPNHACATAGQHAEYIAVRQQDDGAVVDVWQRSGGW